MNVPMNDEEFSMWAETVEILNDVETLQAIYEADEELAKGQMFSFNQVFGHEQPEYSR